MKINPKVIEGFKVYCPTSTSKCIDEAEIIYKIKRAIDIGKKTNGKVVGSYVVNYHNLEFFIKRINSKILVYHIKILQYSHRNPKYHQVDEQLKRQYDLIHRKVSVITKKEVKSTNIVNVFKNKVSIYKGFLKLIFN